MCNSRRYHKTLVVSVNHDDDAERAGCESPRVLVGKLVLVRVWILERDVEHLREVLTEMVRRRCLQQSQHTHPFNGHFSGTTQVSRYQKGKTSLDFTEANDSEWKWHQLGMQVCSSLQADNHASTPPLSFYRPDALPATQSTASTH